MYPNLMKELGRKHISNKAMAAIIGCSEKSVYNKVTGETDFTWKEIRAIKNDLLPEFELSYLFAEEENA